MGKFAFWCEVVYFIALVLDALYKARLVTRLDIYGDKLKQYPKTLYFAEWLLLPLPFLALPYALMERSEKLGYTPFCLAVLGQAAMALLVSAVLARYIQKLEEKRQKPPTPSFGHCLHVVLLQKIQWCILGAFLFAALVVCILLMRYGPRFFEAVHSL